MPDFQNARKSQFIPFSLVLDELDTIERLHRYERRDLTSENILETA
jgi:hypothetical protein